MHTESMITWDLEILENNVRVYGGPIWQVEQSKKSMVSFSVVHTFQLHRLWLVSWINIWS